MLQILIFLLIFTLHTSNAMITINYTQPYCAQSPNFTQGGLYETNLNLLLSSLVTNISTTKNGFYNSTLGRGPTDIAYGLALCQGDVGRYECRDCVNMASIEVIEACPRAKQATIWKEECMVRYSDNKSIFSLLQESPNITLHNINEAPDLKSWREVVGKLVSDISSKAAKDGMKFATEEKSITSQITVYSLAQCSPDLTKGDCDKCFGMANASLPIWSQGGIVLTPSCTIRYEVYPFYQDSSSPPPPPPPPLPPSQLIGTTTTRGKKITSAAKVVIAVIVPLAILVVLVAIGICLLRRKAKKNNPVNLGNGNYPKLDLEDFNFLI